MLNFLSGKPTCRCPVGFSGPFCEKRICDNYCLNGGTCDVTQGNQPVCRCMAEYTGDRCLYRESCWQQTNTNSHWCSPGCLWLPVAPNQKKIIDLNSVMSQKNPQNKAFEFPLWARDKSNPLKVSSFQKHHICFNLQINKNQNSPIKQPLGVSALGW